MVDVKEIQNQLQVLTENKDCIEWVLGQQANLRSELLAFFKKDIKEIDSAISELNLGDAAKELAVEMLKLVRETYIDHWRQSFRLVSPEQLGAIAETPEEL